MYEKVERLCQEHSLKAFYSIIIRAIEPERDHPKLEILVSLAPFIRQFHTKFVNYYRLAKSPALKSDTYENRISEFYAELSHQLLTAPADQVVIWLLAQQIAPGQRLFPDRPVPDNYQDITRSLSVLIELFKCITITESQTYECVFEHARKLLAPELDEAFEAESRELLAQLKAFNARTEGSDSDKFRNLHALISRTNKAIGSQLMGNNTFVSILQQITEINKALKTVRKSDFEEILGKEDLANFWQGLKNQGYAGGENYLYGDFSACRPSLAQWLQTDFPTRAEALLTILENSFTCPELPTIEKENIPEAVQLYSINLIGMIGLRTKAAIRLILGYHSRFVDKMVRDGAFQALKRNSEQVQDYFLTALGKQADYDQMLLIADKHDSIFDHIQAINLTKTFGDSFASPLNTLHEITAPDGILLSNFIRSAYLKLPDSELGEAINAHPERMLSHFTEINARLSDFRAFIESKSENGFIDLIRMWGLSYIVSWALTDFRAEERLFSFIISVANQFPQTQVTTMDKVIPLQDIVTLLAKEPDARQLIQKLMTFLLNSKISFDYRLFSSLFQVVAQRQQQLKGGITIRDGFSEQRGYSQSRQSASGDGEIVQLQDPHIYHPIVVFLITVLHMKYINIPKDAFVETDISLYLNSLAERQKNPELGFQLALPHLLISSIPYIKDFSSHHETVIRKTIADLDESYKRQNILFHYHRIKIHRAPSKLDLDFCLEVLEGLAGKELDRVLENLIRLMKGIGDEAIPDLKDYFAHYHYKLSTLGRHLAAFKSHYPDTDWQDIAEDTEFTKTVRDLPGIDADSVKDIIAYVRLVNALSNYWTQRINESFLDSLFSKTEKAAFKEATLLQKLDFTRKKRESYQAINARFDPDLEPYQHIFLKRHVIQGDWNFDFFGFWPYYKETKFEAYNADRKLAALERNLLETLVSQFPEQISAADGITEQEQAHLLRLTDGLIRIMMHMKLEGLTPSKYFLDTIDVLRLDQLTVSQLHDILGILNFRELSHIDSFIANTFGHFPAQITKALGRENLDFGLDKLIVANEELLSPLVQETVLGNIMAKLYPVHLLENHLAVMMKLTSRLKALDPSTKLFDDAARPPERLSPTYYGYKSYALQTLKRDGFNVPALETLPVTFFEQHPHYVETPVHNDFKTILIETLLQLEAKTGKWFAFNLELLGEHQRSMIEHARKTSGIDPDSSTQLLISARSGSYRSMPGILGTVLDIGHPDILAPSYSLIVTRFDLNNYRMFLSTFGNVVFGISETRFSRIVETSKQQIEDNFDRKIKWEDLSDEQIKQMIRDFKKLIEDENAHLPAADQIELNWNDPLELCAIATISVWNSWYSEASRQLRSFLGISPDWKTPVTLMEMKQADRNSRSFSAILFSGDPQGKVDKPHGDLLFGRPGEDIASGLASQGEPLENLEETDPQLYQQISDLLEQVKINKGYVNVDVEMVGEYDSTTDKMELFVVQERQMPLGARGESEDYRLTPTSEPPLATGKGVNGGVQSGVLLDGVNQEYYALKDTVSATRATLGAKDAYHGPGIFLLMKYVTPGEALKMNIEGVDGVVTTKIGKSSHASIAAKRDGKLFICEASILEKDGEWYMGEKKINLGDSQNPDIVTLVGNPKSVSPYSGNIYKDIMPMTPIAIKR